MNKLGIWAIAIAGAFVIGVLSANPVVEAVGGWQLAVEGLDARITALENQPAPESQLYEVSDTTVIPAGEFFGGTITITCLNGDFLKDRDPKVVTNPSVIEINPGVSKLTFGQVFEFDPESESTVGTSLARRVAVTGIPEFTNAGQPFGEPIEVTVTFACANPSS